MLVPAISRKDELEKLFAEHLYDEDMFFYNGYPYSTSMPILIHNDWKDEDGHFRWAIVDNNNAVIGYFTYYVDSYNDCVNSFGLYSLQN